MDRKEQGYIAQQVLSDLNSPKEVNAPCLSCGEEFDLRTGLQKSKTLKDLLHLWRCSGLA